MKTEVQNRAGEKMKAITLHNKFMSPVRIEMEKEHFWYEKIANIRQNIGRLEKDLSSMGSGVARLREQMSILSHKARVDNG